MKKRLTSLLLVFTCLVSISAPALCTGAGAAESVHAELFSSGWIRLVEHSQDPGFYDDEGFSVYPLLCDGTTYIPLRTVAMWLAADPVWDREGMTVALSSNGREPDFYSRAEWSEDWERWEQEERDLTDGVTAELRRDLTVTVDGQAETFVNTLGEPVYPLVFRDNVYLPLRGVAKLCGLDVLWYQIPKGDHNMDHIILFPFTPETYAAEARSYLDQINSFDSRIQSRMEELEAIWDPDFKFIEAMLKDVRRLVTGMRDLPIPGNGNPLVFSADAITSECKDILREPLDLIDYKLTSNPDNWSGKEIRDYFLECLLYYRDWLHKRLEVCELAYAALAAQETGRAQYR